MPSVFQRDNVRQQRCSKRKEWNVREMMSLYFIDDIPRGPSRCLPSPDPECLQQLSGKSVHFQVTIHPPVPPS